jgi:hypothetical protein
VIANSVEPILYLNLSHCNVSAADSRSLFGALGDFRKISKFRDFHYAGNDLSGDDTIAAFRRLLDKTQLDVLDVGGYSGASAEQVIWALRDFGQPLTALYLANTSVSEAGLSQLLQFLRGSKTLRKLDVSGLRLPEGSDLPEAVARVIEVIIGNPKLRDFSLRLDSLGLHGESILPIIAALFDGQKFSRWRKLSFNSNRMATRDLATLLPLLRKMTGLRSLSLDDNFDDRMSPPVGRVLEELVSLPALERLSVAGSDRHRLRAQLRPLLARIASVDSQIRALDISHNHLGHDDIPLLVEILATRGRISSLHVDDNNFHDIAALGDLIDAVKEPPMIKFGFPFTDAREIIEAEDAVQRHDHIVALNELAVGAVNAVTENRLSRGAPQQLPFKATKEVENMIRKIAEDAEHIPLDQKKDLTTHSCVCELFGLSLPFQKEQEVVPRGRTNPIAEEMMVYDGPKQLLSRIVSDPEGGVRGFEGLAPGLSALDKEPVVAGSSSSSESEESDPRDARRRKRSDSDSDDRPRNRRNKKGGDSDSDESQSQRKARRKKGSDSDSDSDQSQRRARKKKGSDSDSDEKPRRGTGRNKKGSDSDSDEKPRRGTGRNKKGSDSDSDETPRRGTGRNKKGSDSDSENRSRRKGSRRKQESDSASDDDRKSARAKKSGKASKR